MLRDEMLKSLLCGFKYEWSIAEQLDNLLALPEMVQLKEDAAKWRRTKELSHEFLFVRHIERHLKGGDKVICTICGKDIYDIHNEAMENEDAKFAKMISDALEGKEGE